MDPAPSDSRASSIGPGDKAMQSSDEGVKLPKQQILGRPSRMKSLTRVTDTKAAAHNPSLSGEAKMFLPGKSAMQLLSRNSTADFDPLIVSSDMEQEANGVAKASQQPIGTPGHGVSPTRRKAIFTTDTGPHTKFRGGHYIKIGNINVKEGNELFDTLDKHFAFDTKLLGMHWLFQAADVKHGGVFLCFDDLRDTDAAFGQLEMVNANLKADWITQTEYAAAQNDGKLAGRGDQEPTSYHDGQVIFIVRFHGMTGDFDAVGLGSKVHAFAAKFGEVLEFAEIDSEEGAFQYRAEYFKITVAKEVVRAVTKTDPSTLDNNWIISSKELPSFSVKAGVRGFKSSDIYHAHAHVTPRKNGSGGTGLMFQSPTGRTIWHVDDDGIEIVDKPLHSLPKFTGIHGNYSTPEGPRHSEPNLYTSAYSDGLIVRPRCESWAGPYTPTPATVPSAWSSHRAATYGERPEMMVTGGPQNVIISKISAGLDVRTTIMLRNLPNRMTVHDLKQILDNSSAGKYDFSYLRIDFSQNNNVGYGFVNFTDPTHIIDFHNMYVGKPWSRSTQFGSRTHPRMACISYATVQGYECLVAKFRNSAIMDEFKDFRPKLWWVSETAPTPELVGTERPFPPPNNESKHQRSRDNAASVGLFAPRHGRRGNGDYQGRSQYDRGTTAQMEDDGMYGLTDLSPIHSGYGYQGAAYRLGINGAPIAPPPFFHPMGYGHPDGFHPRTGPIINGPTKMQLSNNGFGRVGPANPFHLDYEESIPPNQIGTPSRSRSQANGRAIHHGVREDTYERQARAGHTRAPRTIDEGEEDVNDRAGYAMHNATNGSSVKGQHGSYHKGISFPLEY